jgi:hypothetical protein
MKEKTTKKADSPLLNCDFGADFALVSVLKTVRIKKSENRESSSVSGIPKEVSSSLSLSTQPFEKYLLVRVALSNQAAINAKSITGTGLRYLMTMRPNEGLL